MSQIPVNPNASIHARKLLSQLEAVCGRQIITGQHTQTNPMEEREYIHSLTGHYPKLVGFELLSYSPNINYSDMSEACRTEIAENRNTLNTAMKLAETTDSILTFCFHWYSPIGGRDKAFYTVNTDFDPTEILKSGSPERKAFYADMDVIAAHLKPFCDKDIPILWRPFHEVEGTWFWWGSKGGETARQLYILMYQYFTDIKQLNNLLWVWSSPTSESYPGDTFVDIIGWDIYLPSKIKTDYALHYQQLIQNTTTHKLTAITEVGFNPDILLLSESRIPWVYYMTWSKEFAMDQKINTPTEIINMYHSDYSVKL